MRFAPLYLLPLTLLLLVAGCHSSGTGGDVHSYAQPQAAVVQHLHLSLEVDFPRRILQGNVQLHVRNINGGNTLHLDTRDLEIHKVAIIKDGRAEETPYVLGEKQPFLGRELTVTIPPDSTCVVQIDYQTVPQASALQWLTPEQTAGKTHPFLFSQSQAILARTWVPCQDSPGIRITYSADISVPPHLMAVMSAENPLSRSADGRYHFDMRQPIPSYLLALAVGDLEYRPLGPTSGVYAEPSVIAEAAYEFADTERMIETAVSLYGPYRWDKFDILVLPPSFPFGGMENPRLTFATPTIIAGDRSLTALIAHELAHSWSGNLVTNATWNDFWLNEGFTVYFENRIMEALYGEPYAMMLAHLDYQGLLSEVEQMGGRSRDTHLVQNLAGRDPDDGMTAITYDKGRLFLRMLEEAVGRERFDRFLQDYFQAHAFQSMTTTDFLAFLRTHLLNNDAQLEAKLKIDDWIYGPGLPDNCPRPVSNAFTPVDAQISAWAGGTPAARMDTDHWTTHHWLYFLRNLPADIDAQQLGELDRTFRFSEKRNGEILCAWFTLTIDKSYSAANPALRRFLIRIGRRKLILPLYEGLAKTPEGLQLAQDIYRQARGGYHPLAYQTIDAILNFK